MRAALPVGYFCAADRRAARIRHPRRRGYRLRAGTALGVPARAAPRDPGRAGSAGVRAREWGRDEGESATSGATLVESFDIEPFPDFSAK